jgi:hypothetical protein
VTARGTDACDPRITLTDHNISTLNYGVCNGLKILYVWPEWQMLPQDLEGIYIWYFLRFILIDSNIDVSRTKIYLDTFILESINMNRRKY